MSRLLSRSAGQVIRWLGRLGLDVRPFRNGGGAYAGMQVQWGGRDPGALRGTIVDAEVQGRPVRFFVNNDLDAVQLHHRRGEFYEAEELAIIGEHFRGGTFVDVGANVGNHTLFALQHFGAERVVAFEPHPLASAILEANVLLNRLGDRVTIHRVGLSDEPGTAGFEMMDNNLGATRLVGGLGTTPIAIGDDILAGEQVDFIKIDAEGYELKVLAGLKRTIAAQKPAIFVELLHENIAPFEALCAEAGYQVVARYRRYSDLLNLLAEPIAR